MYIVIGYAFYATHDAASLLRNSKSPVVSFDNGVQTQTCFKHAYSFPECLETGMFRVEFFRAAAGAYLIDFDVLSVYR